LDHRTLMARALELAALAKGRTSPNPMVGAVVVKEGRIIAEGYHQKAGTPHAEVIALEQAGPAARDATLYVTLEPCSHYGRTPPCVNKIIAAGVKEAVVAMTDPNPLVNGRGIKMLREAGIKVIVGVLQKEAEKLNEVFIKYITTGRPFVALKWAMTLDGKIATVAGDAKWISNEVSRAYVHTLRDETDAILVGINTVLSDNPSLNTRLPGKKGKDPIRVILDSRLRVPLNSNVVNLDSPAPTIICCAENADKEKISRLEEKGVLVWQLPSSAGLLDLSCLLDRLGAKEVTSLLVEGGGTVIESYLRQRLADKLYCFIAPKIVGGQQAKTPVEGRGVQSMAEAYRLAELNCENMAGDLLVTGYFRK